MPSLSLLLIRSRSRFPPREYLDTFLDAKIGVDTAENEPSNVLAEKSEKSSVSCARRPRMSTRTGCRIAEKLRIRNVLYPRHVGDEILVINWKLFETINNFVGNRFRNDEKILRGQKSDSLTGKYS